MKSGNLNFLELFGPLQACKGTALTINSVACYMFRPPIMAILLEAFFEGCNDIELYKNSQIKDAKL